MSSSGEPKQYGLILPNKNKKFGETLGTRKLNPLLDSDDELEQDEECPLNWVEASLKKSAGNSGQQSLQKRLLREALEEDVSVFQYDEVYDNMQAARSAHLGTKQPEEKKPKYIHNIIKQAEKRKLEGERRTERKVQKEREAEGEEFADKESFVTASYLKKMEELKKADEEARLEEIREERVDVMKHKNFGVFYNHLFKQRMGELTIKEEPKSEDEELQEKVITEDKNSKKKEDIKRQKHYRTQRDLSESPEHRVQKKIHTPQRCDTLSSSDSEAPEKVESYRDRRERYSAMERSRERERDRTKGRHRSSPERKKQRRRKSRERERGKERSPEQDKSHRRRSREREHGGKRSSEHHSSNRGRQRSGSLEKKQRHSMSRSPTSRRTGGREGRGNRKTHNSTSPSRRSRSPKITIKKEKTSPDKTKEKKENTHDSKPIKNRTSDDKGDKKDVKAHETEKEAKERREERIRKLFLRRTVGKKFDEAVQRYYQRKAEREAQG